MLAKRMYTAQFRSPHCILLAHHAEVLLTCKIFQHLTVLPLYHSLTRDDSYACAEQRIRVCMSRSHRLKPQGRSEAVAIELKPPGGQRSINVAATRRRSEARKTTMRLQRYLKTILLSCDIVPFLPYFFTLSEHDECQSLVKVKQN
jgi:hypothetical protein